MIHFPSDHDVSQMRRCVECGRWYRALAVDLCAACRRVFASRRDLELDAVDVTMRREEIR